MDKQTFISEITKPLKLLGYRKSKNYWYKDCNNLIFCINVQGSQWDKRDYYVEIGIAFHSMDIKNPTLLQWYCRHRCQGQDGEKNILPKDFFVSLTTIFDQVCSLEDVEAILIEHQATKVVSQYWF